MEEAFLTGSFLTDELLTEHVPASVSGRLTLWSSVTFVLDSLLLLNDVIIVQKSGQQMP